MVHLVSPLREMLDRLGDFLEESGAPVGEALQSGLSPDALDAAEDSLGFALPLELRDWYGWRNGVEHFADEYVHLPNGYDLSALSRALKLRKEFMSGDPFLGQETYVPTWVPITDRSRRTLVVDCRDARGNPKRGAPVYLVNYEAPPRQVMPSLTDMVKLWIKMIDDGWWFYDVELGDWATRNGEDVPWEYRSTSVV